MIFEIKCSEDGDVYFNHYKNKEEWLEDKKDEIESDEPELDEYLKQYITKPDDIDLDSMVGRILIEGDLIKPKIIKTISEIDL